MTHSVVLCIASVRTLQPLPWKWALALTLLGLSYSLTYRATQKKIVRNCLDCLLGQLKPKNTLSLGLIHVLLLNAFNSH